MKKFLLTFCFIFLSFILISGVVKSASEVVGIGEEDIESCEISDVANGEVSNYPECAITCNPGYILEGSTCVAEGSSGSGSSNTSSKSSDQSSTTSEDGTVVTTVSTDDSIEGSINTVAEPTDNQIIFFDSASDSQIQEIELELPAEFLAELINEHGHEENILINITNQTADNDLISSVPENYFLIGNDVFYIEFIFEGDGSLIDNFENGFLISFDVSGISNPENLSIGYFNPDLNEWIDIGGTLTDNILWTVVKHTGRFGLLCKKSVDQEIEMVFLEASLINNSPLDLQALLNYNNTIQNSQKEVSGKEQYTNKLISGLEGLDDGNIDAITYFIVYGTPLTKYLGAGERAGVVNSYRSAFGKLPTTENEWSDVIKISIGRWPNERSQEAENKAVETFKKIYLRTPDRSNPNDDAAVTVMAYGLRPNDRNMGSEAIAIDIFEGIFGYSPDSATDWDAVRAIAYSGAIR